jgi:hypothetical protein
LLIDSGRFCKIAFDGAALNPWRVCKKSESGISYVTWYLNLDELVKSRKPPFSVIPAKAGIQPFQPVKEEMDSDFHPRGGFLRDYPS